MMLSKTHSKYIQSLHHKKFRDAENAFIAEGNKVVTELLQSKKFSCDEILATKDWLQENEKMISRLTKIKIEEIPEQELKKISALSTPNRVLAVFKKAVIAPVVPANKINLLLDDIRDPGNMGTIIRIADWFGVANIICSPHCADIYNPKVVQSTMGSIANVNVFQTNLAEWIKQHNIKVYATSLQGKSVGQFKGMHEGLIVIGNESKGISGEILQLADERITIPRFGNAESLNAAVATGIILSQLMC